MYFLIWSLLFFPGGTDDSKVEFKASELAKGLWMLEGVGGFTGGNLGLLVGPDGVILIDDSMPPFSEEMLAAIRQHTDKDISFVINTHVHADHTGNNENLQKQGATIVAHDNIRARMLKEGVPGPDDKMVPAPKDALPVLTFADGITFHFNGQEAQVIHVAKAHTDGDAIIFFKQANVIHTGDILFNGLFPFIDLDAGGTVAGYIAAQEKILTLANDQTRIIPGHGPLAHKQELQASLDMLKECDRRIADRVKAGKTQAEILAENPLSDFHDTWNWGFITTERMTKTLIREHQP
ncbi:MAG: MBL fold metallo-hydrolase [Acidobacteria bacterium]|nr:MBL fold metallo-hydrolase [Acidobacteriota bacterium]